MIPYFQLNVIPLGPVHIQVWGLFVAAGILAAVAVARWYAKRHRLDVEAMLDLSSWAVLGGILGARLGHVIFYAPARYLADPLSILRVWEGGMSMFGGFIGAALAMAIYFHRSKLAWRAYAEALAFAFPLGYGIGRIGCFLIHDHPGTLSHFLLAVKYPGGARLDHGLLLSLVGFAIFAWFMVAERRTSIDRRSAYLPTLMIAYGLARFILDFFRAYGTISADARYGGLTPAQFLAIGLMACGAWMMSRDRMNAKTSL